MQQELLLEFFCEEIPARFQRKALVDAKTTFTQILNEYNAVFSTVDCYISPRRITFRVTKLVQQTDDISEEKRGPKVSAPQNAIDGFLRSNNKSKEDLLEKDGYYYLKLESEGIDIKIVIPQMIEKFIENMPWQKSMRWYIEGQNKLSPYWVRPIRSILCIYDGSPLNLFIESLNITTCDYTFGHRFLSSGFIRVLDFDDYSYKLEKNYVMLDYNKKKKYISKELDQRAAAMCMYVMLDKELLDELAGLVEYPFIHIGTIDEKFMKLPPSILSTSMKVHQKYFTLIYPDSVITPFFGTATNVPGTSIMYEGLDKVLRARLTDAMFFYKEDTDVTLEAFSQRLSNIVFHDKLGTIAQKVDRMMSVANTKEEHRAIALCKADLLTQMVGEFPELQGTIGEIYAKAQDEETSVCNAIRDHYKPLSANDILPSTRIGARVSFFDKLDTLVGFIGLGIYPTGSKDPLAIRRTAFGLAKLLSDFLEDILDNEKLSWYIERLISSYSDQGIALDIKTLENVNKFLIDKLRTYISDKFRLPIDIVNSSINSFEDFDFNYKECAKKALQIYKLSQKEDFSIVQEAYKRVLGVLGDNISVASKSIDINNLKFTNLYMESLQELIIKLEPDFDDFDCILRVSKKVLNVCDNVLINNNNNNEVKTNNIALLNSFINLIKKHIGDI